MDYFDDLDQTAMDAFGELSCDSAMRGPSHTTALSPDLAIHCQTFPKKEMMPITPKHSGTRMQYLFKLGGNISYELLCAAAILSTQPKVVVGEGENGVAQFCQVNAHDLCTLKEWLASRHPHFRPYPVWYFFYGTLADTAFLGRLFGLPDGHVPILVPAVICGGKIRTWGGKYKALVDSWGEHVDGWACEILAQEHEDALRVYETAKYEVVRVVMGSTFRFAGNEGELN
ncbi:hypothetical protein IQ06DRAFT_316452 [Phaeosphaeriaceae sp. SRC1lsM3a]|nr:hypothetical protein IQ06DRAFT_316452 [Stagonospora sp. SRC1lsM3a]